jgi:hypothetical protein
MFFVGTKWKGVCVFDESLRPGSDNGSRGVCAVEHPPISAWRASENRRKAASKKAEFVVA